VWCWQGVVRAAITTLHRVAAEAARPKTRDSRPPVTREQTARAAAPKSVSLGRPTNQAAWRTISGVRVALAFLVLLAACSAGAAADPVIADVVGLAITTTTTSPTPTTTTTSTTTPLPTTTTTFPRRSVAQQAFAPFATVGGITLLHPSERVEMVGFHESGHDGAQQLLPVTSIATAVTMETRERDTVSRGAADIVVDPTLDIYAPVTGTVKRAGTYVLYCEYSDDFAVIEPDDHPGWEVKILHINQVQVRAGDRVEAGLTMIAIGPTPLPFESQVDELSWEPSWPHVHIEVVDPSIPDRPSGPGC